MKIKKSLMEENKEKKVKKENNSALWFVPEIVSMVIVLVYIFGLFYFYDMLISAAVERAAFSVIMIAVLGFAVRKQFPVMKLNMELSVKNLGRFWWVFIVGLVASLLSVFIPSAAWPFTGFFVVLAVFSNSFLGMLGGTTLLIIAAVTTGSKAGIVILYLICGGVGIAAFFPIKDEIKIWRPLLVTLLSLFTCETTGIILTSTNQIAPEQFLLPGLNIIITGIIIFLGLRLYALKVKYPYRDRYQLLNDTEYYLLAQTREDDKKTYKHVIHTSYFTERIATRLGLNVEAMKCAGYYYRFCPAAYEEREEFFEKEHFPGEVCEILTEYSDFIAKRTKNRLKSRECAVLLYSHTIIHAVIALYEKNPDTDITSQIDKLVDATFSRYEKAGIFAYSNLTYNDVTTMMKIFKEEKLYYELLR